MQKWRCTICDYVYDPAEGDMENGVAPGTPFEELSDGWVCPICGVGKDLFEQV
jgi:rubredoxin